jgi:hypothetical protein
MKVNSSDDYILEVIERLVVFKIDMKAVFNTNLHLHGDNISCSLDFFIRQKDCKVCLFYNIKLSCNNNSDEVSDSTSYSLEGLILLLKVRKLEFECFVFTQNTSWLQLL